MYIYKARFIKATVDGIDVYLDLGFYMYIKQRVKLFGITIKELGLITSLLFLIVSFLVGGFILTTIIKFLIGIFESDKK